MKTIEDIYSDKMTPTIAEAVLASAIAVIPILKQVLHDRVHNDVHDPKTANTVAALKYWKEIHYHYSKYLKDNHDML